MSELTLYLDKATKNQFSDWLFVYCNNKRSGQYSYDKGRNYSLSFPVSKLDNCNQISVDAIITEWESVRKINEDTDVYSYNDFTQTGVIKITWLEIGERAKVMIDHVGTRIYLQPVLELLAAIAQDWQGTRRDILEYTQAQATRHGVTIDTSHFPADPANDDKDTKIKREALMKMAQIQIDATDALNGKPAKNEGEAAQIISERTEKLNKLSVMWAKYNQTDRISKDDGMGWFIETYAPQIGVYVTVDEFKRHLPKAREAQVIGYDKKARRYVPINSQLKTNS